MRSHENAPQAGTLRRPHSCTSNQTCREDRQSGFVDCVRNADPFLGTTLARSAAVPGQEQVAELRLQMHVTTSRAGLVNVYIHGCKGRSHTAINADL